MKIGVHVPLGVHRERSIGFEEILLFTACKAVQMYSFRRSSTYSDQKNEVDAIFSFFVFNLVRIYTFEDSQKFWNC